VSKAYPPEGAAGYPAAAAALSSAAPTPSLESVVNVQRIVRAVRRRLGVMAAVFLLIFSAIAAYTFQLDPMYRATASVIINTRDQKVVDFGAVMSGLPGDTAVVDTEVEILKSGALLGKVARRLDLINDPEFNPEANPDQADPVKGLFRNLSSGAAADAATAEPDAETAAASQKALFDGIVDDLGGRYTINRVGMTYIIEISATSGDPKKAALLANTLADTYLDNQLDAKFEATRRAQEWLDARVGQLRQEVSVAESRVEQFRASRVLIATDGSTLNEQAIRETNAQLTVAQAELAEKRARLQNVNNQIAAGGGVDTIAEAQNSPNMIDLRRQQTEIVRRKGEAMSKYGERHPEMLRIVQEEADLNRQIDAELRRIVSSLEQDVLIVRERVASLNSSLGRLKGEVAANNVASVELAQLERERDASKQVYEDILIGFKQTNELEDITEADAMINTEASAPTDPAFPNKRLNLALGFLLGLALAGLVGLLLELLDNYFSSPEDVEIATGVPYIGSIPLLPAVGSFAKAKIRPADYLMEKPHSGFSEAFRHLRASIMFADIDKAAKTVAIVSSLPDEGKTSITFCLGRMSAMSGTKTIVIDGDLRRRQLTEVSGIKADAGLLEYLFGEARLQDAVVTDEPSGLHVLPLSDRKHTPRDVFGSRAFDALLALLQQSYDLIIIDTGPILLMAETRVVTSKVDQVVVAARWRKTSRGVLRETIRILRDFNANLAGVVLTFVDLRKRSQHSYGSGNYKAYAKYYSAD
jgi:capsular exopolysaccharide synthesis family protein